MDREIYEAVRDRDNKKESVLVTVIEGEGKGEKALVTEGVLQLCTLPGAFLDSHRSDIGGLDKTGIYEIDGSEIYAELLGNEIQLVVFGAGHLSLPIIDIAHILEMRVTVVDDRREYLDNAIAHGAEATVCRPFDEAMELIEGSSDSYFIVVTRGHRYDSACVGGSLRKPHAYVGMIGSRRHAKIVKEKLIREGLPEELVDSVHTPIGIDIAAETPEEIAVSIMGEVIEVKNRRRRKAGFSKDMMAAILSEDRGPAILVTIVETRGSTPRTAGAKMLVYADGSITGTIGGGIAEAEIMKKSAEMIKEGFTGIETTDVDMIAAPEEDGMVCGGSARILLEMV